MLSRRNSYPTQAESGGDGYQSRRPNPYAQQDASYEMSEVKGSSGNYNAGGGADEMSAFYAEVSLNTQSTPFPLHQGFFLLQISSLQDSLRNFNDNVSRIGDLHSRSLNNTDDAAAQRNQAQLQELVEDTSALSATLKRRIKALERQGSSGRDGQIRKQQVGDSRLVSAGTFLTLAFSVDCACQGKIC
jgi:syntaxin 1B/2/3